MRDHITRFLPAYSTDGADTSGQIPLPQIVIHKMHISDEEEHALGILQSCIPYKALLPELPLPQSSEPGSSGTQRATTCLQASDWLIVNDSVLRRAMPCYHFNSYCLDTDLLYTSIIYN